MVIPLMCHWSPNRLLTARYETKIFNFMKSALRKSHFFENSFHIWALHEC